VKRAQDEAKSEIDSYRRTLEEDFKKKQDEVSPIPQFLTINPTSLQTLARPIEARRPRSLLHNA
jgi:hypothetical protein